MTLDEVNNSLLLLLPFTGNLHRLTKGKVNRSGRNDRPEILEHFSRRPGPGQKSDGYNNGSGSLSKLDADAVKFLGVEVNRACVLGKDYQISPMLQVFGPFFHDDLEVVARIDPVNDDWMSGFYNIAEDRIFNQAALDNIIEITALRHDQRRQHKGFECAHVVADKNDGAIDTLDMLNAGNF